jgi:ABC-type xylose transport system permease subunit
VVAREDQVQPYVKENRLTRVLADWCPSSAAFSRNALSAFCATVLAACQVFEFGSAAADRGLLKEFEAIIAVVIGGTLLTAVATAP